MLSLPFAPQAGGASATLNSTGSSQTTPLTKGLNAVRIVNFGATNPVYVRIGDSTLATITATVNDLMVRANSEIILRKNNNDDTLAYLQNAAATTLVVQCGTGSV